MRAFIFPGQGSQSVGMGVALAQASRAAKDVFDEVDEALGQNLFRLMRDEAGCRDALFLDGTLSQLWTKQTGYVGAPAVMLKPYVGMFAVFGEPAAKSGN